MLTSTICKNNCTKKTNGVSILHKSQQETRKKKLSHLIWSLHLISYLILSELILSCLFMSCLVLSCLVSSCFVFFLSRFVFFYIVLSCMFLFGLFWFFLIWSCLISCLLLQIKMTWGNIQVNNCYMTNFKCWWFVISLNEFQSFDSGRIK